MVKITRSQNGGEGGTQTRTKNLYYSHLFYSDHYRKMSVYTSPRDKIAKSSQTISLGPQSGVFKKRRGTFEIRLSQKKNGVFFRFSTENTGNMETHNTHTTIHVQCGDKSLRCTYFSPTGTLRWPLIGTYSREAYEAIAHIRSFGPARRSCARKVVESAHRERREFLEKRTHKFNGYKRALSILRRSGDDIWIGFVDLKCIL